jgi:hypothetical protein
MSSKAAQSTRSVIAGKQGAGSSRMESHSSRITDDGDPNSVEPRKELEGVIRAEKEDDRGCRLSVFGGLLSRLLTTPLGLRQKRSSTWGAHSMPTFSMMSASSAPARMPAPPSFSLWDNVCATAGDGHEDNRRNHDNGDVRETDSKS